MNCDKQQAMSGVMLAAIGVVYGDIGTSPLYTLRECLSGQFGFGVEPASILGFLSLISGCWYWWYRSSTSPL